MFEIVKIKSKIDIENFGIEFHPELQEIFHIFINKNFNMSFNFVDTNLSGISYKYEDEKIHIENTILESKIREINVDRDGNLLKVEILFGSENSHEININKGKMFVGDNTVEFIIEGKNEEYILIKLLEQIFNHIKNKEYYKLFSLIMEITTYKELKDKCSYFVRFREIKSNFDFDGKEPIWW